MSVCLSVSRSAHKIDITTAEVNIRMNERGSLGHGRESEIREWIERNTTRRTEVKVKVADSAAYASRPLLSRNSVIATAASS